MADVVPPYPPPGHEARRDSLLYAEDPIQEQSAVIEKETAEDECKGVRVFSAEGQFPEGGLRAWTVVVGSFSALFMVFGMVNSTAVFQQYFSSHQLRHHTAAEIGWIFSLNLFFVFFGSIFSGRVFDSYGPRLLVAVGSLAMVLSMMLLEFCTGGQNSFLLVRN